MNNKTLIYRPTIEHYRTNGRTKNKKEVISLKDWLKDFFINTLIFFLGITIFVLSVAIAYHTYLLIKLKVERFSLLKENKTLKQEYQLLTSKEVVLRKAKILGLYPPEEKDFLRLE
jgi:cell division protein FtsL